MDSITDELSDVIHTLEATRSNSRALDLAQAVIDIGAKSITISAEAKADPRPTVLIQSDTPMTDSDTAGAQRVMDVARDLDFLADLYAAGEGIDNFMHMTVDGDITTYTIDFGGNPTVYAATLRAVLTAQLNTALNTQMMGLIARVSGVGAAAQKPPTDIPDVRF